MGYYNSGRRARELGIGSSGSLPSNPDLEYVFHDQKNLTPETLKKILGRNPTPEDVAAALEIASRPENQNLETFVQELLSSDFLNRLLVVQRKCRGAGNEERGGGR